MLLVPNPDRIGGLKKRFLDWTVQCPVASRSSLRASSGPAARVNPDDDAPTKASVSFRDELAVFAECLRYMIPQQDENFLCRIGG